jgi:actin-related protein 6
VLGLNNERFMVPEAVFTPPDLGLRQGGLAQAVTDAILASPPALHPLLFSNVLCTGGLAACAGFRERLTADLRALAPDDMEARA